MESVNFKNISLGDFYRSVIQGDDKQGISDVVRHLQKGAFEILWRRHRKATKQINTYTSVGTAQRAAVPPGTKFSAAFKSIKEAAVTGLIRSPVSFHNDFRFITFVHEKEIFCVLENAAIDARLSQIWRYDIDVAGFIPCDRVSLMEFLIGNEIAIPAAVVVPA